MRSLLRPLAALMLLLEADYAFAYIDPQTTHTVVSGLGALLATIGGIVLACGVYLRTFFGKLRKLRRSMRPLIPWAMMALTLSAMVFIHFEGKKMAASQAPRKNRLILLGIDGMDPVLTREGIEAGRLPNFARLAKQGDFRELATVNPVQSPVVWTTMATGIGPGEHGIVDFIRRRDKSYTPDLALVKSSERSLLGSPADLFEPPVNSRLFFWETLVQAGIPARVLRWPLTFPASGEAQILAGLGTPDLNGNLGRYTLFTTKPAAAYPQVKGRIVTLSFDHQTAKTSIEGPTLGGLLGERISQLPLVIERKNDSIHLIIGDQEPLELKPNELSSWVKMRFPMGLFSKADGLAHFMVIENGIDFGLYMSPIEISPERPLYPIATKDLSTQLTKDIGMYHTLGMAEDTNALGDGILDEDQFLTTTDEMLSEAERMFWHGFDTQEGGLYSFVFDALDRIQHMFWRYRDPEHPLHEKEGGGYEHVIEDYYARMDRLLGKVLSRLDHDRDTLLVVSDHGFTSYRRNFHVNSWLIKNGFMTMKSGHSTSEGLFQHVDWSQTQAFALGFSQIYLNRAGREPEGIVSDTEAPTVLRQIKEALLKTRDPLTGVSAVTAVYETGQDKLLGPNGPDLVVGLERGYRFSWQTAVGGSTGYDFEDNAKKWSGDHCVDPQHVPGVIFASRKLRIEDPSVFDIAPTALSHFGLERNSTMPGRSLF